MVKWCAAKGKVELADIINVMLNRRMLSLQRRATPMWAHQPEDMVPVKHFFRSTPAGMWTLLFKPSEDGFPPEGSDRGFKVAHDAPEVICKYTTFTFRAFSGPHEFRLTSRI